MTSGPDRDALVVAGMTWGWTGERGSWGTPESVASLDALTGLEGNWIAIAFAARQATAHSTEIEFGAAPTVTDDEVRWATREAHSRGLSVCLKPVVNCADGTWRAHIGFFDDDVPGEPNWAQWFESYERFILHYAVLAHEEGCDLLCVGCEMVRADSRESEWRSLIAKVRAVYSGPITYNCDKYQEDRLRWWDAVDVMSSSGYYPAGEWPAQLDRIERAVRRADKPFFFMEAGCPSREGSAARPNDWTLVGDPSESEQASYYLEMFWECAQRDWMRGFMLWDWPARLYSRSDASTDTDYCVFAKSAEAVVREEFVRRAGSALSA
jgi:hypothetical protein